MKKNELIKPAVKSKTVEKRETSYHHGDLRNLVLKVAGENLETKGVHNLSLRDVAAEIGVSHTAPYKHFPRKLDLLHALTTLGFLELRDTLTEASSESANAFEKLRKAGENYIKLMWKYPRRTELMFGGEVYHEGQLPEDLQVAGEEAYLALYHIVEYGQLKNDFRKDVDTESLSMSVWSGVHGFAVLNERNIKNAKTKIEKEKLDLQMKNLLEMLMIGIRA
ncbi:MAG: TetR/AcrR family transcriptional regulator [Leptospira sp.]|nr:TetR/AcrR family transcriptional regulator [Leptospira sp.]